MLHFHVKNVFCVCHFIVASCHPKAVNYELDQEFANVGREVFHCAGSRNNVNLCFKFAIAIRQNKCNHLLLYMLSFIQFCERKLLLSITCLKIGISLQSIFHKNISSRKIWIARIQNYF